jgi:hypothetical protein
VLDVHFVLLGAAISAAGQLVYARDTLRGAAVPNRVSFTLFSIAPLLAFGVELSEGEGLRSLTTFMFAFGPMLILAASFGRRAGTWHLGRLDYTCGAVSLMGTAAWLLTRHGTVGIAASVVSDGLAGLPMIVKSWTAPDTESGFLFVAATVNGIIGLLTVDTWTTAAVAFPLYIVVFGFVLIALVPGRLGPRIRERSRR